MVKAMKWSLVQIHPDFNRSVQSRSLAYISSVETKVKWIQSLKQMLIFPSSKSVIKMTKPKKKINYKYSYVGNWPPAFCSYASAELPACKQSTFQQLEVEASETAQIKSNY